MSRRRKGFAAPFVFLSLLSGAPASTALAQEVPTLTADEVIAKAETTYGPPPPKPRCQPQQGDEIVVCAEEEQDQDQFRVKSSSELDPTSEDAIDDGLPRAPDVSGPGIFKGKPTVSGLCLIPPCPGEPAYIIDFSQLPETPEGSDADRVGQGLVPRGDRAPAPVLEENNEPEPAPAPPPGN